MAGIKKLMDALDRHSIYGKSTEEIATEDERECERKFTVDIDCLEDCVEMPRPWRLLQGYLEPDNPEDEISIRVVPARNSAYLRRKSMTFDGCRSKISSKVDYKQGVDLLLRSPKQVFKYRYLVRDPKQRAWLVDYFPELEETYTETEFPSQQEMKALDEVPEWIEDEVTDIEQGYTRSRARSHTEEELRNELADALEEGSTAPYEPSEDSAFQWVMVGSTWEG